MITCAKKFWENDKQNYELGSWFVLSGYDMLSLTTVKLLISTTISNKELVFYFYLKTHTHTHRSYIQQKKLGYLSRSLMMPCQTHFLRRHLLNKTILKHTHTHTDARARTHTQNRVAK